MVLTQPGDGGVRVNRIMSMVAAIVDALEEERQATQFDTDL